VIESALADELAAITLEQKELLQRTGAGSVGWVPLAAYSDADRGRGRRPPDSVALRVRHRRRPSP